MRRSRKSGGVVVATEQEEAVGQPERTGEKRTLVALQAVDGVGVGGAVAQDEAVLGQVALDRLDGGTDTVVGGGEEAHERHHEETGVESVGAVVLGEGAHLLVEPFGADLLMDRVTQGPPFVDGVRIRRIPRPS